MSLCTRSMLSLALLFLSAPVFSAPEIVPKDGYCPSGYHTEGRYCVSNRGNQNAPTAIPKDGYCPSGFHTEGRYCVSNRH